MSLALSDSQRQELEQLVRDGRDDDATKLCSLYGNVELATAAGAIQEIRAALATPRGAAASFDWAEVDAALQQGELIEAIRRYRELSGASLAEAKRAVEDRRDGRSTAPALTGAAANAGSAVERGDGWDAVDAALARGELIQAIKCYRDLTGAGLKDAKEAVEARRDGRPTPSIEEARQARSRGRGDAPAAARAGVGIWSWVIAGLVALAVAALISHR